MLHDENTLDNVTTEEGYCHSWYIVAMHLLAESRKAFVVLVSLFFNTMLKIDRPWLHTLPCVTIKVLVSQSLTLLYSYSVVHGCQRDKVDIWE